MLGGRERVSLLVGREVDEGCAASRATVVALLFGGEVDRLLGRMLGGWRERVALLVGRKVDDGCAAHWERVGRRLLLVLVGREVDEGCAAGWERVGSDDGCSAASWERVGC
jgi:hypothetical protein